MRGRRITAAVLALAVLCACGVPPPPAAPDDEGRGPVPEWAADTAPAAQEPDVFPDGAEPVHFDVEAIRVQAGEAGVALAGIYRDVERYSGIEAAYLPTQAQRREIAAAVGALGYTAVCDGVDMVNAQALRDFCRVAEEAGAEEAGVYTLGDHGQLTRWCFSAVEGSVYSARLDVEFAEDGAPVVGDIARESRLDDFALTDKGFLFFGTAGGGWDGLAHGFRVEPLGEENRELCRRYIDPLGGFNGHNILLENWDGDSMERPAYNDVFGMLYVHANGVEAQDVFTGPYPDAPAYVHAVPGDAFEAVILRYFDLTAERLRELAVYDAERRVYAWQPLVNGGFQPSYEVVDHTWNADGSLTLVVDAYSIRHRAQRLATCTLRVMPGEDGALRYLSNSLEPGDGFGLIPAYQPRACRQGAVA